MAKSCVECGKTGHTRFNCPSRARTPLKRTRMRTAGVVTKKWLDTRRKWIRQNPAEYYFCLYCNRMMTLAELTLDHYKSRSRHPELRYSLDNLVPCCYECNATKGPLSGDEYIRRLKNRRARKYEVE